MSENSQTIWKCIWYNNLNIETWSQFEEEDPVARDWDDAPDEIVEYRISHPAKELTDEWHSPGLGEIHNKDHSKLIICFEYDNDGNEIVSDSLANQIAAILRKAQRNEHSD